MVALSLPVFFARTPEDFFAFTRARKPDPATGQPDMRAARQVAGRAPGGRPRDPGRGHRAAAGELRALRVQRHSRVPLRERRRRGPVHPLPVGAGGRRREPLRRRRRRSAATTTCRRRSSARLGNGPAAFRLVVTLAELGDPVDDPTEAWPAERETVVVGRLELTGPGDRSASATGTCWCSTRRGWSTASS